ncbi:amino acid adenylation domain-containing protein [Streptomyces sp. NBC_01335]|uniref:amino acid adenylation domain-containing protein n=1 Tax=Streptomyces sp. NBC_01335 TaxID=2903828 RepID=UPI002E0FD6FF|nr:amino acid adenylation domain-containing protein [Streptomyces sp. NBC_01335]
MTGACVHHLVAEHARRRPDAVALHAPGRTVGYRELLLAAERVAAGLRSVGVGPGSLVAVFGPATPELMAGILGTLTAGAAWLPLGLTDPPQRTRALLEQARPDAALCGQEESAEWDLRSGQDTPSVVLGPDLWSGPAGPADVPVQPDDLAYVMFTSGSTGVPKGVEVTHRSLVNYCRWVARANRVDGGVALLPATTRLTSDACLQQVIAPLTRGDAVWLVDEGLRLDPERLLGELAARPGAGLHCVPALWEELLLVLESAAVPVPALSSLFLGGDRVREDLWLRTRRLLPHCAMANVYGPTEATVQATGGFQPAGAELTVGRPADNVRVLVLDDTGRPVRAGDEGEVHLGGVCLARGYRGAPAETAERFTGTGADRLYRTGDVGALLPDGTLRLRGRLDDQVKIRGNRVEPGEIEAALAALDGVGRAALAVASDSRGAVVLAAGVESDRVGPDLSDALLAELATRLPGHFVPAALRVYDRLPLLANGKVDRAAIAAEALRQDPPPAGPQMWGSALEEQVAEVWNGLMDRPATSPDDDFFALGGHSLLAVQAAGRLTRRLDRAVDIGVIFEHRTVRAVAAAIAGLPRREADGPRQDTDAPCPLSVQQQELWRTEEFLAGTPFNTALLPVLIDGPLDVRVLTAALGDVVAAHPALRGRVVPGTDGGEPTQTVAPATAQPCPVTDLGDLAAQSAEKAVVRQARGLLAEPLDPVHGPVLRARLVRLAPDRSYLLLAMHHLFCDGVSLHVVLTDLAGAYRARLSGGVGADPGAAPVHLRYAAGQRAQLEQGRYAGDLAYWAAKLSRPVPELRLGPLPASGADPFSFVTADIALGAELARRLRDFAGARGATPFICLTAALAAALHARSALSPVRLGTLTANREDAAWEHAVGLFSTTLALDVPVDPAEDFDTLVAAARAEVLESFTHQRAPMELAFDALPPGQPPFRIGVAWEPLRPPHRVGPTRFEVQRPPEGSQAGVLPSSTAVSFVVREEGDDVRLALEVSRSVLDEKPARHLLEEVRLVLDRLLTSPGEPVARSTGALR